MRSKKLERYLERQRAQIERERRRKANLMSGLRCRVDPSRMSEGAHLAMGRWEDLLNDPQLVGDIMVRIMRRQRAS